MNFNSIYAGKFLTCTQAVDPVLLTIISLVSCPVATTIPWLYADERRILRRRRPQTYYRSSEIEAEPRTSVHTVKSDLLELAVLKHKRVNFIECIV